MHYNVLREENIDSRKVIINEKAPLYHVGDAKEYVPMLFIVSDNDMKNRYEQTMVLISTLEHFEYDMKYQMPVEECGNMLEFEIHLDFIAKLAYNSIKSRFTKSRFE